MKKKKKKICDTHVTRAFFRGTLGEGGGKGLDLEFDSIGCSEGEREGFFIICPPSFSNFSILFFVKVNRKRSFI